MVLNKVTRFYIFMAHGVVMSAQVELKRCPVFSIIGHIQTVFSFSH